MSEYLIPITIEHLEEGEYLATSSVLQGLIAQGRTIAETLEIAEDVARRLIELRIERNESVLKELHLKELALGKFDTQIPVPLER